MGNGKRRNEEMGSTLHFTQQTADILLLQSSNIMCDKKVNVHPAFIEIIYTLQFAPKGHMQQHCILHHGRQASTSLLAAC